MLLGPIREIKLSEKVVETRPFSSAKMLPKSPTWRTSASRPPWAYYKLQSREGKEDDEEIAQQIIIISLANLDSLLICKYNKLSPLTLSGLKCDPVEAHPPAMLPNSWIWNPWCPGVNPSMLMETWVGSVHDAWSKVMFPRMPCSTIVSTAMALTGFTD